MSLDLLRDLMGKARGPLRLRRGPPRRVARRGAVGPRRRGRRLQHDGGRGHRRPRPGRRRAGASPRRATSSAPAPRPRWPRALAIAEAQPARGRRRRSRRSTRRAGTGPRPCEVDPFDVSLEDKLGRLFAADGARCGGDERIVRSLGDPARACARRRRSPRPRAPRARRCSSSAAAASARAPSDGGELQVRSYPSAHGGHVAAAGWEHVLGARPAAARAARRGGGGRAAHRARRAPRAVTTIVLDGEQLALQVHESVGHALELDRILCGEASYAGTSWVAPDDIGSLRYGSEQHERHRRRDLARRRSARSAGTTRASPAQRTPLVEDGVLRAALSNRESAAAIGLDRSGGCARADGFARQPIVRMTNVSIEPGDAGTLADLIADTDEGVYLETNRSWSIDDRRLQFQFGTEVGREIRGGELGRLYRNASYAGIGPRFWGSLDAVCSAEEWRAVGPDELRQGRAGPGHAVSHGAAPARFRDVQVGVA